MEPINLAEARAQREGNATLWTPLDCLKSLIRDIEAGVISPDLIFIAMQERHKDGSGFPWRTAGGNRLEILGLLAQHFHEGCK